MSVEAPSLNPVYTSHYCGYQVFKHGSEVNQIGCLQVDSAEPGSRQHKTSTKIR